MTFGGGGDDGGEDGDLVRGEAVEEDRMAVRRAVDEGLWDRRARVRICLNAIVLSGRKFSSSFLNLVCSNVTQAEQLKKLADVSKAMLVNEESKACIKTAEMRWVAAKKMEEAAKAAEALALAEINALSSSSHEKKPSGFLLPEPEGKFSPLTFRTQRAEEASSSKLAILRMMEEAVAEVMHSKQALEAALNRVENANKKQLAAGEALIRWAPDYDINKRVHANSIYSPNRFKIIHPTDHYHPQKSPLNEVRKQELVSDEQPKPVLRPTVSMRDILSRKQVLPDECVVRTQAERHPAERQKVALSQMLKELREDLSFPKKAEIDCVDDHQEKPLFAQRRKFGFIHISLPLTKQSKKKMQAFNPM